MKPYSLLLILILLTTACNSKVVSQRATTTATPTITKLPALISTDLPKATSTVKPTTMTSPTPGHATETPTLTPSLTSSPGTETPTPISDFDATTTAIVKAVIGTSQPRRYTAYLSPDQKWRTEIIIYDCVQLDGGDKNAYEQLKLIQMSNGTEQVIDSQLQYCSGIGAYGLGGLFWSPNSRYFYYTDAREGVPDGGCWHWERSIYQLDVVTQKTVLLGGGPLSRDKTRLAIWQAEDLVIWDLDKGELGRVAAAIPGVMIGPISWSPDSQSLAYLQAESPSGCLPSDKSYLIRFDISNLEQNILLESETPIFINLIWDIPNRIKLTDEQGKKWQYNLVTKELKQQ
jgi:hypothetical protein